MPSRRAATLLLALGLLVPSAACAGGDTPTPDAEAPTEDGVDADLVPGDPSNATNTDPGGAAPGAQPDRESDPEDQVGDGIQEDETTGQQEEDGAGAGN